MHVTIKNVIILFLLILLVFGCGKGQKNGIQSTISGSDSKSVSEPVVEYIPATGDGLRPDVSFDYDFSGYTSNDGFTVVPMADDFIPADPNLSDLSLAVTDNENGKQVDIYAENTDDVFIHLRYDPELWEVDGVGRLATAL